MHFRCLENIYVHQYLRIEVAFFSDGAPKGMRLRSGNMRMVTGVALDDMGLWGIGLGFSYKSFRIYGSGHYTDVLI